MSRCLVLWFFTVTAALIPLVWRWWARDDVRRSQARLAWIEQRFARQKHLRHIDEEEP